jgi:intracellular septation protein A
VVFHPRSTRGLISFRAVGATLTWRKTKDMGRADMSSQIQATGGHLRGLARMAPVLAGNVVLPYLIYLVLGDNGFSTMTALTASAVPPVLLTAFTALRKHKLDMVGLLSLATIVIAIATSMLTGNARFMLAKDGLFPLIIGLAMLVSLAMGKPLIFYVIRKVFAAANPAVIDRLDRAWQHQGYRDEVRRYTALDGLVLLVSVVLQVLGAFTLPIGVALPVLNVMQLVLIGGLVFGTRVALSRSMRSYAAS